MYYYSLKICLSKFNFHTAGATNKITELVSSVLAFPMHRLRLGAARKRRLICSLYSIRWLQFRRWVWA